MHKALTTVALTALTTSTLIFGATNHQNALAETNANGSRSIQSSEKITVNLTSADNEKTQQIVVNGQVKTVKVNNENDDIDKQLEAVLDDDKSQSSSNTSPASQKGHVAPSTGSNAESTSKAPTTNANTQQTTKETKDRANAYAQSKKRVYIEKNGSQVKVWSANSKEQVYNQFAQQGIDLSQLQNGAYYIVQWGDTLHTISNTTNIEIQKIANDNGIINIDKIFEGQTILLKK